MLVAVLLLVALVTILVVTTSMLSRIERGAVSNEANTELAQQNAMFGLNVALAQLQKTAGPDQRVTARAEILDSIPATPAVDGFQTPSQAYWTGVWKTGSAPPDYYYTGLIATTANPPPTPQRTTSLGNTSPSTTQTTTAQKVASATWLVSDPIIPGAPPAPMPLDPTALLSASNTANFTVQTVVLAKNLPDLSQLSATPGPTPGPTVSVSAPLVSIYSSQTAAAAAPSATPSGKYAYWVSDEGVKAKVNLADPTYTGAPSNGNSAFVESQLHFSAPQAIATQDGLLGSNNTDIRVPTYTADVTKVTTVQSLSNVGVSSGSAVFTGLSGSGASQFAPDVTTCSYGVLADVRNGGLKQDLSQVFENPGSQFLRFLNAAGTVQTGEYAGDQKVWSIATPSFDAGNSYSQTDFGVRWQSLYNYYSLYKNAAVYPSTAPWSDLNSHSSGMPGTPTPTIDTQYFSYTSNSTGATAGGSYQQLGESYAPQVLGFGVQFSMNSVKIAPTGSNPNNYNLILYAEPKLILYNPYNVTLNVATAGQPFITTLYTNVLSSLWSVIINDPTNPAGAMTILNEAPTWTGVGIASASPPTAKNNELTFTISPTLGTYVLKPGEIRVYGLSNVASSNIGNVCVFANLGDGVGQSQWEYLQSDNPVNGMTWTANVSDATDVTVSFQSTVLSSNDGYYNLVEPTSGSPVPSLWPINSTSSTNLVGRFFNSPAAKERTQSADLGQISGMVTSLPPSGSAGKPFGYFVMRAKGLSQTETSNSSLISLPTFSSADGNLSPIPTYYDNTSRDTDFSMAVGNPNSLWEIQTTTSGPPFNSYWGGQDAGISASDPSFLPLRDVPRQPMLSLGQFMHMPMRTSTRVGYPNNSGTIDTNSCMMGVGGSLADPYFPISAVTGNGTVTSSYPPATDGHSVAFFDDNFLMNQALFDTYYFSSVPQPVSGMDTSYKAVLPAMVAGTTAFTDANVQSKTCVLPNARMSFYFKGGVAPQTSSSAGTNYLPDYQKAAANLLLNGAFNVNSTSIPAWRALLSSLNGNNPSGGLYAGTITSGSYPSNALFPIFRFLSPTAVLSGSVNTALTSFANPFLWGNVNVLVDTTNNPNAGQTVTQVTALATAIVKQVKRLGPFLSMADFLNRRLTTATDSLGPNNASASIGLRGALQAAIDDTTINSQILALGTSTTGATTQGSRGNSQAPVIAAQLPANTAIGVPGCLMQQDLVQCFSPVMAARSDTFLVRCYGEADNAKTGATVGRAWGEAVVQRLPDFVDQNDPALIAGSTPLGDATPIANVDAANWAFGRRFKVVSFRWLNESDL